MNKKLGFLFSGQGSQYAKMGLELASTYDVVKDTYNEADQILGFSISDICFQENDKLNVTSYTQPAIVTTSVAFTRLIDKFGIKATHVSGLSLGEYSALCYSKSLSFEDCLKLVYKRGTLMQECVPVGIGTMAAIIGLSKNEVSESISTIDGIVELTNHNCPGQIIIGGEKEAVHTAMKLLEAKAKKVVELNVSGPFHTSMLKPAAESLYEYLQNTDFKTPVLKTYSNVTGKTYDSIDEIKTLLKEQVMSCVNFDTQIREMINDGVTTFIEFGPKNTLCNFAKFVAKDMGIKIKTYNVEDIKTLEKTLSKVGDIYVTR